MISIHWPTRTISIPQAYLTDLGGGIYELDTEVLRLDLKDLEDDEQGISYLDTHNRNAPVTLSGATYSQTLEIINGYTVTFEDGQYAVVLSGSNNNIADVTNVNQVSIRSFNSAGLQLVTVGSGVLPQDKTDIISGVWDRMLSNHVVPGSAGKTLNDAEVNTDVSQAKIDQL